MDKNISSVELDKRLHSMCIDALKELAQCQLITMNENGDEWALATTPIGRIMARYCIRFDTMKSIITQVHPTSSMADLVQPLAAQARGPSAGHRLTGPCGRA